MAGGQGVDRGVLPLPDDQLTPAGAPDLVLPNGLAALTTER